MLQFYKPNSKNTGSACSFYKTKDGAIMFSMIKQSSWNEQKKTGSFQGNKDNPNGNVKVKLSLAEAAGFIDCVERDVETKEYHNSPNQTIQIKFSPYVDREGQKKGFSLSVSKQSKDSQDKPSFVIGLNYKESRLLKEYLSFIIQDSFANPKIKGQDQDSGDNGGGDYASKEAPRPAQSKGADEDLEW